MSNDFEFEWIEPTQEHIGQMIEVRDDESKRWKPAKLTGILADEYKFAAKTDEYGSLSWKHARIARQLTYVERQAKCGLKVGDVVKVVRAAESHIDGWENQWLYEMNDIVGKTSTIDGFHGSKGIRLLGFSLTFPYFVLEKVDLPQPKERSLMVAELEVGEIIQITQGHWIQILPFGSKSCTWQSGLSNQFQSGWIPDSTFKPGNRPAKELYRPEFSSEDIGKLAVYTKELKDRFFISGVSCDESSGRVPNVTIRSVANGKQVTVPLSDVRVIS